MKRKIFLLTMLILALFSFNVLAMENYGPITPTPATEVQHSDRLLDYKWTWLDDGEVARFQPGEKANTNRGRLQRMFDLGAIAGGYGPKDDGGKRDIYSGKWSQDEKGTWSFVFDDNTIPIDLTRIDGVLYAFNGYGELVDGYEYWNGQKTGPDGVVTCTAPEFLAYLETQYLPNCTSHK